MNKCVFIGRITKDLELIKPNDTSILNFSLAVNRKFKKEGQPTADFPNFVALGKTAEFVNTYFEKGSPIAVVARFQTRSWDDDDGKRHYVNEFLVEEVDFAGNKNNTNTDKNDNLDVPPDESFSDEDIPF